LGVRRRSAPRREPEPTVDSRAHRLSQGAHVLRVPGRDDAVERDADGTGRREAARGVPRGGENARGPGGPPAGGPGVSPRRRAALLSHHYWDRDLNRDPSMLGQSLMLDGKPATVVGVLDPAIEIGNLAEIDVWIPLALSADAPREERTLRLSGRLKPGMTIAR